MKEKGPGKSRDKAIATREDKPSRYYCFEARKEKKKIVNSRHLAIRFRRSTHHGQVEEEIEEPHEA